MSMVILAEWISAVAIQIVMIVWGQVLLCLVMTKANPSYPNQSQHLVIADAALCVVMMRICGNDEV